MRKGNQGNYKNKCQRCYQNAGQFLMDCYCILCEYCLSQRDHTLKRCRLCQNATNHKKIDVNHTNSMQTIKHLFTDVQKQIVVLGQICQYQTHIDFCYMDFLEKKLEKDKQIFYQIRRQYPQLKDMIDILLKKPNTKIQKRQNHSLQHKRRDYTQNDDRISVYTRNQFDSQKNSVSNNSRMMKNTNNQKRGGKNNSKSLHNQKVELQMKAQKLINGQKIKVSGYQRSMPIVNNSHSHHLMKDKYTSSRKNNDR